MRCLLTVYSTLQINSQLVLASMSRDRIATVRGSKLAMLQQWNEDDDEEGDDRDFLLHLELGKDELLLDDFQTLKLSGGQTLFTPPVAEGIPRPSLSPGMFMKYVEKDDDEITFSDDGVPDQLNIDNLKKNQIRQTAGSDHRFLPATTTSPLRRRSLSDYSENTETDITEMNDDDFEEIDNIFGKEESGIYSSGGGIDTQKPDTSRASDRLAKKKRQLQKEADLEDRELFQKYRKHHGEEVNTLKLKDLHKYQLESNLEKDALENERTVNYEYTRDDFESFEDGFDADLPAQIEPERLRHFHSSGNKGGRIQHKTSMPVFPNSLRSSKLTKFKSTMDLASAFEKKEHPVFNNSNKLIRKLDRMPSFHSRKELNAAMEYQDDEELNNDMERKKKELLEKYMEITEKQKQLKTSPKRSSGLLKSAGAKRHGVGLVRYLNDKSAVPVGSTNGNMKFNARTKRWEGNEHELLRFDEEAQEHPSSRKQPSLITLKEFDRRVETIKGNMKYDAENLRWVNLDESDEVENHIFDELPDLEPNDIPRYRMPIKGKLNDRGVSTFTQRTILSVSSDRSSALSASAGDEFQLGPKLMAKFHKEELKIYKKTHHWFGPNESYKVDRARTFNSEYFWEIRKMVMDDDNTN